MIFKLPKMKYSSRVKAFTLVETMSAIAIVSVVVLGPLTVAVKSSAYARETKDVISATYLAEEAVELLHNQYDSLYIACINSVAPCDGSVPAYAPLPDESLSETVWRIFKTRMTTTGVSCSLPNGCTYDFVGMSGGVPGVSQGNVLNPLIEPVMYTLIPNTNTGVITTTPQPCSKLNVMATTGTVKQYYYACSSVTPPTGSTLFASTQYVRKVTIESVPSSFESMGTLYQDDLRIVSDVSFKRPSGVTRKMEVIDFLHARP
jgi:hypothetical protein